MRKTYYTYFLLFWTFWALHLQAQEIPYRVQFDGDMPQETLSLLNSVSQLTALQDSPPSTQAALQRRAEADIAYFINVLHNQAYFNAHIDFDIDFSQQPALVRFVIVTGPIYPLQSFEIVPVEEAESSFPYDSIQNSDLGILLHKPALPKNIIEAEDALLQYMAAKGCPLAKIKNREILADQATKTIKVILHVDSGPTCCFGETQLEGNELVSADFINRKIGWKIGDGYDPDKIEYTQRSLEATGLFSSISIERNEVKKFGTVPIAIHVVEGKHRSIGAGIGYATQRGPGFAVEWEHRNVRRMGEKVSFKSNLWKGTQEVTLLYLKPDFYCPRQDLLWLAEYEHERTRGYTQTSYSFSGIIEKQLNDNTRISYGGTFKNLYDTRSNNNRGFNLAKTPFHLRWNNTNNLLDPTEGCSINLKLIPSVQMLKPQFLYCINTIIGTFYLPLNTSKSVVFATKVTLGSIFGATHHAIPPSERFYAGSENALRGYHYLTVSPLNHDRKPVGGRSMMIYSFETRLRLSETIGCVFFYEVGNVYLKFLPSLNEKVLQSAGIGIRYHTPVGPLRVDIGIPLNRRKHIDGPLQIYVSIGQAF